MFQTKFGRTVWFIVVCFGFIVAGSLISRSYSAWKASPVSTSISTHKISDLDFPTVTVCPPKGSNTALNYDLMKADNNSLTYKQREGLKNASYDIFIKSSSEEYVKRMLAGANPTNIKDVHNGFQTAPTPYGTNGFKIAMWKSNGSIETPWFGGKFMESYYQEDRYYLMILEFPDNIAELVGKGLLKIQLEVDTRVEEGWEEKVV